MVREQIKCPVCQGHQRVLVQPLSEDPTVTPPQLVTYCRGCANARSQGLEPGHVIDRWSFMPRTDAFVVERIDMEKRGGKSIPVYIFNIKGGSYSQARHNDVTSSLKKAEKLAVKKAYQANLTSRTEINLFIQRALQSASDEATWKVGYYQNKIKTHANNIETLTKRLAQEQKSMEGAQKALSEQNQQL